MKTTLLSLVTKLTLLVLGRRSRNAFGRPYRMNSVR
jgi:hypothetical protein